MSAGCSPDFSFIGRWALSVGRLLMHLTEIPAPDFDLAKTLDSGQVFHWDKIGDGFLGIIDDRPTYVERCGESLRVKMEGGGPATPGSQELAPSTAGLV